MIGKTREYNFEKIATSINELISLFDEQDNTNIVRKMKTIVPEYISQNSVYEELDK
jgi:hypothetical protein